MRRLALKIQLRDVICKSDDAIIDELTRNKIHISNVSYFNLLFPISFIPERRGDHKAVDRALVVVIKVPLHVLLKVSLVGFVPVCYSQCG